MNVYSDESSLTINQQLERLQREVSDISKMVFNNEQNFSSENNPDFVKNLSAIDMRIYDLEKDVKNLTSNIEDLFFKIDDLIDKINSVEDSVKLIENISVNTNIETTTNTVSEESIVSETTDMEKNSLGNLKITKNNDSVLNDEILDNNEETNEKIANQNTEINLNPEDQFQLAFDNIRQKNWEEAKMSFINFIDKYPENQLSGSAHYWLGELYILEKKFRDAALILAEGFQKYPESIKSPEVLFKLSYALKEVNKSSDSCKTLEKLIIDYPKHKINFSAKKQFQEYGCLENVE